ncbi:XRE family transcriptional regulator [Sphingomonas sp. GM_Shp_1]|uniref:LexA family transcriptional regulator n=1 Tax=Sphingomonas sp. GM_Shp_1 TaxID=2937381 RepID=UPI00226B735F|nr:XRE family transcriptional regulator [Sphingomonas sp. GM_Shp_1]
MTELLSHRSNAAKARDDRSNAHKRYVRFDRTSVNDENGRRMSDTSGMAEQTVGSILGDLRRRSGLSLDDVAKRAGYKGRSSVQAYFANHYDPARLDSVVAEKLAMALVGLGTPPIERHEIMALVGIPVPTEVAPIDQPMPTLRGAPRDLPVFGTALGADLKFPDGDGEVEVEQTLLTLTEAITYVRRPPAMEGMNKAYALFVVGSSMEPRYRPGEPVFIDPVRPPQIGDDVIIQLFRRNDDGEGEVVASLVKTLRRRTAHFIELEQYEPRLTFKVPNSQIAHLHRIISMREAFFG